MVCVCFVLCVWCVYVCMQPAVLGVCIVCVVCVCVCVFVCVCVWCVVCVCGVYLGFGTLGGWRGGDFCVVCVVCVC